MDSFFSHASRNTPPTHRFKRAPHLRRLTGVLTASGYWMTNVSSWVQKSEDRPICAACLPDAMGYCSSSVTALQIQLQPLNSTV